jgi:hypothetical protein
VVPDLSQALARRENEESAKEQRRDQTQPVYVEPRVYYKLRGMSFRYGSLKVDPFYSKRVDQYHWREYFIEVPRIWHVIEIVEGLKLDRIYHGLETAVTWGSKVVYGSNDLSLVERVVSEVVRAIEENMGEMTVYVVIKDFFWSIFRDRVFSYVFQYYVPNDNAEFSNAPWIRPIGYAHLPPRYVVYAYASIFNPYFIEKKTGYIALPYTEEIVERLAELLNEYHMRPASELESLKSEIEGLKTLTQRRAEERREDLVRVKMVLYRLPSEDIRGISSEVASELRYLRKKLNEALHKHGYKVFDLWVLRSDVDPAEFARSVVNKINFEIEYLRSTKKLNVEPGPHVLLIDVWLPRGVLVAELKRYLEERREVLREISQREQEATGAKRRALAREKVQLEEEVKKLEEELKKLEGATS